jgi:hypothetical protein
MNSKLHFLGIILLFLSVITFSQKNSISQNKYFVNGKFSTVNVAATKTSWNVRLMNLETPFEGNKAYEESIQKIKREVEKKYPKKYFSNNPINKNSKVSADSCVVLKSFQGNYFNNSTPNDNTLAINNNGMLISCINSTMNIYDTQNDTLLKSVALAAFSDTLDLDAKQYDPKLLYDADADKFVMTYLSGTQDSTSNIVVAFSQSSDPLGLWNLYSLTGNPLNDSSWSDYPAISITNNELFLTVNLLCDSGSWQTSFKQSVIWQIDKSNGYAGDSLHSKVWSNIKSGSLQIRNIHPVQGGSEPAGPDEYLLSNRNFAIQSDTIFLLHISNVQSDTNAVLTITPLIADKCYGMPPDAAQAGSQTLATNDARVLGAFLENDMIQFVGNSIDTLSGMAVIYHGIISNIPTVPVVHLNLISDTMEFGYPNISYTGATALDNSAIISVNYSGLFTNAGFCAINYNGNTGVYSQPGNLKSGNSYVNLFSGTTAERWGDYSGSQRVYNEPGKVWVAGFYGFKLTPTIRAHETWIAQLQKAAPDAGIATNNNISNSSFMNAYPNPVNDMMFVDFTIPEEAVVSVLLFDGNGRQVKQLMHGKAGRGKNLLSFSMEPLSPGNYFVTVNDASGTFLTKKLVKE